MTNDTADNPVCPYTPDDDVDAQTIEQIVDAEVNRILASE